MNALARKLRLGLALSEGAQRPSRRVRKEGLEPPYPFGYQILSLARLPVPPLSRSKQPTTPSLDGPCRASARRAHLNSGRPSAHPSPKTKGPVPPPVTGVVGLRPT